MPNLNKVFLIGNLTRDPELRYTANGIAVTDLGIALNRSYTTKDGDKREEVTFLDVTVWNRQAENCCQYLKRGQPVHVEGFIKMESWDDKATGEKRSKLKVEAERVQFLGGRKDEIGGGMPSADEEMAPPPREARRPGPAAGNGSNGPSRGGHNAPPPQARRPSPPPQANSEGDDDIPF